ncbi:MAG: hypothetical protein LIO93_08475 [Bacteroidales bacterium]|nr:hypothetical protein [Bacteroidales bacterium]
MYIMTSDIQVGDYSVTPLAVKWKCSTGSIVDTCSIELPRIVYLPNTANGTDMDVPKTFRKLGHQPFEEGDPVTVKVGYNHDNRMVFKGFVKRINQAGNLQLECEGYSYQLNDVVLNACYHNTTIKKILKDLTRGTDILLSTFIPYVELDDVTFKNFSGMQVLEWFQKNCLCEIFFDHDTFYVGALKHGIPKPSGSLRLGWNTIEDKDFKKKTSDKQNKIQVVQKTPEGEIKKTIAGSGEDRVIKEVKIKSGLFNDYVTTVAEELYKKDYYAGFGGNITCFLQPFFEKAYTAQITDQLYPERSGLFFVETVEGSFDSSGGRQKLTLNYYGNVE